MDTKRHNFSAALAMLQQCVFFEEYKNLTNEQAVEMLLQRLSLVRADSTWYMENPEYRPNNKILNAFDQPATADSYKEIANWDFTRVWSGDLEADVCAGNEIYVRVTEEYARLSMGTLQPVDIVETWHSEEGPVTLSFYNAGQHFSTELAYYNDWIDGEIFSFLDDAMYNQGFSSTIYSEVDTGQDIFLVRATEEEKNRMEQLLGWSFDWRALSDGETETE